MTDDFGCDVIAPATWAELAGPLGLPPEARRTIVEAVGLARLGRHIHSTLPTAKRNARDELKRLHGLADKLTEGLKNIGGDARREVAYTLPCAPDGTGRIYSLAEDAEKILDTLRTALDNANLPHGVRGADRSLRHIIMMLDDTVFYYNRVGLVRSTEATKTSRGSADACRALVTHVARLVFPDASDATIDDAMKDVIRERRKRHGEVVA